VIGSVAGIEGLVVRSVAKVVEGGAPPILCATMQI
jgi:hypothetical protein